MKIKVLPRAECFAAAHGWGIEYGIADFDVPISGEDPAIAGVSRGHDAVKHIDALGHAFDQVFWRAHPHKVAGLIFGKLRSGMGQDPLHVFLGLPH